MTVAELIAKLKMQPQDLEVLYYDGGPDDGSLTIDEVSLDTIHGDQKVLLT